MSLLTEFQSDFIYVTTGFSLTVSFVGLIKQNAARFALLVTMQSTSNVAFIGSQYTVASGLSVATLSPGSPNWLFTFRDYGPIVGGPWGGFSNAAGTSAIFTEIIYNPVSGSSPQGIEAARGDDATWFAISQLASSLSRLAERQLISPAGGQAVVR